MLLGVWTIARGRRRLGWGAVAAGLLGIGLGVLATLLEHRATSIRSFDATLVAQTFGLATPLIFGAIGRNLLRAERRREHRARGDDADGRLLGHLRRGQGRHAGSSGSSWAQPPVGCSRSSTRSSPSTCASDQIVGGTGVNFLAVGITGYFFVQLYHNAPVPNGVSAAAETSTSRVWATSSTGRSGTSAS